MTYASYGTRRGVQKKDYPYHTYDTYAERLKIRFSNSMPDQMRTFWLFWVAGHYVLAFDSVFHNHCFKHVYDTVHVSSNVRTVYSRLLHTYVQDIREVAHCPTAAMPPK